MSSDNASSAVTYTYISSDSNRPSSWGIPLENAGEIPEMDPYEEVAQQGQAHPLSPAYDQPYAEDASPTAKSPGYIADSDSMKDDIDADSIDYPNEPEDGEEDDDEDPEEDPSEEHDPEDDDEDPEEDPNEEDEPSENSDETEPVEEDEKACATCTCLYLFVKCQPLNFKGTEGVVGLNQCLKKMESIFHVSGCAVENQVKFATCTLLGAALTWWNGHVRTLGHDAAYAMTWGTFKKKLSDKYCPTGEIKKLEIELWNLKVKGNDVAAYTQRFQELALMCTKFLVDETAKIDKYIGGLPDNIHGNVMSARPKTLDFAIELANDLMDQKLRTYAERQNENKRKADDSSRNNHQQQSHKRQNVARAYTAGPGEKKVYTRDLPLCTKCNYHHTGQCAPKCGKCKRYGHAIKRLEHAMNVVTPATSRKIAQN
ncbi:putative reverse transcriptase domain-containing protein [Tanacetum coccineum]